MNESDFLIETYPIVKPGGQHVGMVSSAIQVTHIPTQLKVICSHERSQVRNKNFAVEMINNALEKLKYEN
jgi:peptide chain release factor 2